MRKIYLQGLLTTDILHVKMSQISRNNKEKVEKIKI